MLAFNEYFSSLALSLIVIGFAFLVLPSLDRTDWRARSIVLGVSTFLAWRYVGWRYSDTVPAFELSPASLFAWSFLGLEVLTVISSSLAAFILTRTRNRSVEASLNQDWWVANPPAVDVYIATYNEELSVIERTIAGAKAMAGPPMRIFVLDDGRRNWLEQACKSWNVEYRTRPDNAHAKAGNLNYTLSQRVDYQDAPAFVAVLDADFVPHRDFVTRALSLFHDSTVGLVQTPQHFFNPDPIQHNLGISEGYPDEQRFFFDHVEPARDAWGIAICCGTSSIVRTRALRAVDGFPTESVTEDFLLSLRLDEIGWRTVYLNEPLTEGLAPEGLKEYIVQRGRWCLGLMQIVRNVYNPFGASRLRLMHRVGILDSFLYWSTTFSFRIAGLIVPLLYWYMGVAVVSASVSDVLSYYLPYYLAVVLGLNWISRGMIIPMLNDVSQLVAAWPVARASMIGIWSKGPHRFRVTAKGGDRTQVVIQWPILWPFMAIFLLTLFGLFAGILLPDTLNYDDVAADGIVVIVAWSLYNLIILALAMAACVERPREDRPQRSRYEAGQLEISGKISSAWIVDLGVEQVRVLGPANCEIGESGILSVPDVGPISAEIASEDSGGYHLKLAPTSDQRRAILRKIHTRDVAPGTSQGSMMLILKQLARSVTGR